MSKKKQRAELLHAMQAETSWDAVDNICANALPISWSNYIYIGSVVMSANQQLRDRPRRVPANVKRLKRNIQQFEGFI
jgi:ubiquitin-protein ligase